MRSYSWFPSCKYAINSSKWCPKKNVTRRISKFDPFDIVIISAVTSFTIATSRVSLYIHHTKPLNVFSIFRLWLVTKEMSWLCNAICYMQLWLSRYHHQSHSGVSLVYGNVNIVVCLQPMRFNILKLKCIFVFEVFLYILITNTFCYDDYRLGYFILFLLLESYYIFIFVCCLCLKKDSAIELVKWTKLKFTIFVLWNHYYFCLGYLIKSKQNFFWVLTFFKWYWSLQNTTFQLICRGQKMLMEYKRLKA